jgi:hypothetical protein
MCKDKTEKKGGIEGRRERVRKYVTSQVNMLLYGTGVCPS